MSTGSGGRYSARLLSSLQPPWLGSCISTFICSSEQNTLADAYGISVSLPLGGLNVPGEDDTWDFGTGAGFYVDATREPWNDGYRMYSYVSKELPEALCAQFRQLDPHRISITGHSMGGHGALTIVRVYILILDHFRAIPIPPPAACTAVYIHDMCSH